MQNRSEETGAVCMRPLRSIIPSLALLFVVALAGSVLKVPTVAAVGDDSAQTLRVTVMDAAGNLLSGAKVAATDAQGLDVKATEQPDGTYVIEGVWAKTILEVDHPWFVPGSFELTLPDQPVVQVEVILGKANPVAVIIEANKPVVPGGGGAGDANLSAQAPSILVAGDASGGLLASGGLCDGTEIPEDEPDCGLPTDTVNGGCNSVPPIFSPIACGDTYCGTAAWDGAFRDTDWYEIITTENTAFTWTVTASFPFVIGYVPTVPLGSGDCATVTVLNPFAVGSAGQQISIITDCLPPGIHWFFVAPDFAGPTFLCGPDYVATLTCTAPCEIPTGACCFLDGTCVDGVTEDDCGFQGGTYQGDGSDCASVDCPELCGPGAGDCCQSNGTPGCEDPDCCQIVCAIDPFCCDVTWDSICAGEAEDLCGKLCFVPPPDNDNCADAIPIDNGDTPYTTIAATDDAPPLPPGCDEGFGLGFGSEIWFNYNSSFTGILTVSTCDQVDYDSRLAAYTGGCANLTLVACNDDGPGCGGFSSIMEVPVVAGEVYQIAVGGFNSAQGSGTVTLTKSIGSGACCLSDGSCIVTTEPDCAAKGGNYVGDGTNCGGGLVYPSIDDCANPFEDISGSGIVAPNASNSDDDGDVVPIGFTFNFYGDDHTDIGVASNGYLTFGADLSDFTNDPIPDPLDPNDGIYPYWDDWSPNQAGTVYYETKGAAPNRRFIAQWDGVEHFGGLPDGEVATFQAILFEGTNCIEFRYGDVLFFDSPTVGIENQDGTVATPGGFGPPVGSGDCKVMCPEVVKNPCAPSCPADIDGSGDVGVKDLLFLLGAWGDCPAKGECLADFDDSGDVGVKDLLFLLGAWGDCP